LVLVVHPHIPKRTMPIHPLPTTITAIDGHYDPLRGDSNVWINKDKSEWRCDFRPEYGYVKSCGFSLSWGAAFNENSPLPAQVPICSSQEMDDDGDGWGWENEQSCVVADPGGKSAGKNKGSEIPDCVSAASDEDGDGWGWENEQSCKV